MKTVLTGNIAYVPDRKSREQWGQKGELFAQAEPQAEGVLLGASAAPQAVGASFGASAAPQAVGASFGVSAAPQAVCGEASVLAVQPNKLARAMMIASF